MTITTNEVLNQYVPIRNAQTLRNYYTPYIDFILKHTNCDRISVRELGEELMGKENYHKKYMYMNGEPASFRTTEAREVTGVLTQALRKLCNMGVLERHEEKDMTTQIDIEVDGYVYYDQNGYQLPEQVELKLADGHTITIDASSIKGVKSSWGKVIKQIHPKIVYYTFNK